MINNYILGLFATDGNVRIYTSLSGKKTYSISLEMKDEQIIKEIGIFFNKTISHRKRIINNKERHFYCVRINNENYGKLLENKQNFIHYFNHLSTKEQRNFIRGCYDGDGGICRCDKNDDRRYRVYFCANTKDGMDKIYEKFFENEKLVFSKYYDHRGSGAYCYNNAKQISVRRFLDIIYENADMKLQRKYDIYLHMVSIS